MKKITGLALLLLTFASCINEKKVLNCKKVHTGKFYLTSEFDNTVTIIERTDSIQVENSLQTGRVDSAKVTWLNDCEYQLQYYFRSSSNNLDTLIGNKKATIKILATGKTYYIFSMKFEDIDLQFVDTLRYYVKH